MIWHFSCYVGWPKGRKEILMDSLNITGIVTVPFFAKAPITLALAEALPLNLSRIIVVHDRKGSSATNALAAIESMRAKFQSADVRLDTLAVDEDDTTLRWRRGILAAFEDARVDAAFVFASDFAELPSENTRAGWQAMRSLATKNGLVLGDYHSEPGTFKGDFEDLVGMAAVEAMFPSETSKIRKTGLHRLRTEFFVLGKAVYEQLWRDEIIWTLDPTIDLTLTCLRSPKLALHVVDLRDFKDDGDARDPLGQLFQMTRFVSQLAINRIRLERSRKLGTAEQIRRYDALRESIGEAFAVLMRGIDKNRAGLAKRKEVSSDR